MKRLLLIGFLSFSIQLLFSQTGWEYVITKLDTDIRAMDVDSSHVAVGGSIGSCKSARLFLFTNTGTLLWEDNPFDDGSSQVKDVYFKDNYLWVFGEGAMADDYNTPGDGFRIAAYSLDGEREVYHEIPIPNASQVAVRGFVMNDSLIVLIGSKEIFWLDPDSGLYSSMPVSGNTWDAVLLKDSVLVLEFISELQFLSIENGSLLSTIPANNHLRLLTTDGQSLWFVDGDSLWHRSANNMLTWLGVMPTDLTVSGMCYSDEALLCWGQNANFEHLIYRFSSAQGWELYYDPGPEIPHISAVEIWNQQLYTCGSTTGLGDFVRGLQAPDWSLPPSFDLELTDLFLVDEPVIDTIEEEDGYLQITVNADFQIEITNVGSAEVDHLVISSNVFWLFNCAEGRLSKTINNANLSPGESLTQVLHYYNGLFIFDSFTNLPIHFTVWGSNHRLDENPENNEMGEIILTNLNIAEAPSFEIRLFPNPTKEEVFLEIPEKIELRYLRIYNLHGQLLQTLQPTFHQGVIGIGRNGLANGVYWIQLETSKGMVNRKLVFQ